MKLLKFFEAESKNVVIQRLRRTAKKPFECRLITYGVACINSNSAAHVAAGFTFNPQAGVGDQKIEPAAVRAAIQWLVSLRASSLLEAEEHGANEGHEGALAGFVRPV